jgi:hypothetical protein
MVDKSDLMGGAEVKAILKISDTTLKRYRLKRWIAGVHFVQPVQRTLYIRPMIEDWILNHKTDPEAHQRAIEAWVAKHQNPPDRKRRLG